MIVKLSSQMPPTRLRYCLRYFSDILEQKPSHRFYLRYGAGTQYTKQKLKVCFIRHAGDKGCDGLCYCDLSLFQAFRLL